MKRKFEKGPWDQGNKKTQLKNPKVITYCDFGTPGRKTEIGRHLTFATAMRQYARLWEVYGRVHEWRVWQESQEKKG
jgi:hypothetical protein